MRWAFSIRVMGLKNVARPLRRGGRPKSLCCRYQHRVYMPYHVYILQSELDGTYYVGSTHDLEMRVVRHNQGGSRYTKARQPWKLVHSEQFESKSEALIRERHIKKRKSREYIEKFVRRAATS